MSLRLPSLQALLVFETSARLLSFTKAAGELNVTPVAVSRMVARLEDALGFKLFERTKLGLTLTDRGATLQHAVASGFGQIGDTIEELKRDHAQGEIVTLSLASGFAALWLLPRYAAFRRAFPSINLRLQVMAGRLYGPLEDADLGIRLHGPGSNTDPLLLCPEIIVPVCSPNYLAEFGRLDAPRSIEGHAYIHLDVTTLSWIDFHRATGLSDKGIGEAVHHTDPGLAVQCAMLGQGVVLGWLLAIAAPLNEGKVIPAWDRYIETGCNYVLEYRSSTPSESTRAVARWLIDEMRKELDDARCVLAPLNAVPKNRAEPATPVPSPS
ncbi:LysR family transcriptional regulator [Caballeronia novacaledonica]|uniref:LysR family transcriptional regulator n=1 Tax=Caballeronia novacaledonica TaxID=1544861 RepID=A0A2U3IAJ8_9BURK|nr:LysR family transcriptional regulator [Caballeronia novacaledonica]SPB17219.1 LysR family transcriptional regulator [Caballeronia novacaledonica]